MKSSVSSLGKSVYSKGFGSIKSGRFIWLSLFRSGFGSQRSLFGKVRFAGEVVFRSSQVSAISVRAFRKRSGKFELSLFGKLVGKVKALAGQVLLVSRSRKEFCFDRSGLGFASTVALPYSVNSSIWRLSSLSRQFCQRVSWL